MLFEILMAALLLLAFAMLAPSLLKKHRLKELDRNQQNVAIARERLDEVAAEHASGEMSDDVFAQVKDELEASLIDDVQVDESSATSSDSSANTGRNTLFVLLLLVPVGAVGLYQKLGSPQYIEYAGASAGQAAASPHNMGDSGSSLSMEDVVEKMQKRVEQNPQDGETWFMLAKTHMSMKAYDKALSALQKAYEIFGDQPPILLGMADAMAMIGDGDLTGKPSEYIEKALQIDPDNSTGLWLGGMSAQQNGDFDLAVKRWLMLMPELSGDDESLQQLKMLIAQAIEEAKSKGITVDGAKLLAEVQASRPTMVEQMPSQSEPPAAPAETSAVQIKAWVSLDPAIKDQVSANDTLFVFAKATSGPPMPLAAFKGSVADLPLEVTLDDSMAMMPQLKISGFPEVAVSARIAKGGTPMTQPGDITSEAVTVETGNGTVGVELKISKVVQ